MTTKEPTEYELALRDIDEQFEAGEISAKEARELEACVEYYCNGGPAPFAYEGCPIRWATKHGVFTIGC